MLIDCVFLISKQANIYNKILIMLVVSHGYNETEASGWPDITPKVWERAWSSVLVFQGPCCDSVSVRLSLFLPVLFPARALGPEMMLSAGIPLINSLLHR